MTFKKEDWEFTDQELIDQLHRGWFVYKADPFNGRRRNDREHGDLIIHAADRIKMIRSIKGN